jgi:succinate---hydroxymethylglutarate CoA-transferase
MTPGDRILEGVRVLDLTTFVTGGFCSAMLANQGAEVIKVERPGVGDDNRHSGPPFIDGESPYFWTINYGKKSVELDLKSEAGRETLYELASESDVFIQNYRPGTAARLDVDEETIRSHREDIIYCSISAFGDSGPWSDRPGYDLLIQGMSGIMSVTGPEDGDPVKVGLPQTDLITATWAAFGISNALYRRERTGEGDRVELGMLDAALPWLTKQAAKSFVGETPTRMGTKDPVIAPYQSYPTADGYLNVACANQKLWTQLCEEIGREDLVSDPRFESNADRVENMDALEEELSETFTEHPTEEWVERLADGAGLPVGPVYEVDRALHNEQVEARGAVDTLSHPAAGEIPILEHPLNFDNAESGFDEAPPMLGEDTDAVVEALGYSKAEIEELHEKGVLSG